LLKSRPPVVGWRHNRGRSFYMCLYIGDRSFPQEPMGPKSSKFSDITQTQVFFYVIVPGSRVRCYIAVFPHSSFSHLKRRCCNILKIVEIPTPKPYIFWFLVLTILNFDTAFLFQTAILMIIKHCTKFQVSIISHLKREVSTNYFTPPSLLDLP
jgi:hypothetical protein